MVQIAGTYEFVSAKNYSEYLASFGLSEEIIQKVQKKSPIVITSADDEQLTVSLGGVEKTFVFNEETEYKLPTGQEVKTTASVDGNKITFKSQSSDGDLLEERVFEITDDGLTSTSTSATGVVATREYKRV